MRRSPFAALLVGVLTACSATTSPPTTSPYGAAASRFAASADRALDGTRFESLPLPALADALVSLCESTVALPVAVAAAVTAMDVPEEPEGDAIMAEVLVVGVAEVCPDRAVTELSAAYLAAIGVVVRDGRGLPVADDIALTAGLSVCATLATGTPDDALVVAAAGLFGIEASAAELLGGGLDAPQAVTVGAVLGASVTYLCPDHRERIEGFLARPTG